MARHLDAGHRLLDSRLDRRLFPSYLKQVSVGKPTDELYEGAKRWALEPVRRKGEELSRVTLLRGLASGEDVYDVHDSLEDFLDARGDRPIHADAWELALESLGAQGG